ncbi:MAG: hypothetical protein LPJ89_01685 [Hymenobacteraceae bacterium]|nr:hypothetical protein [Hymenobacteraceae bacterium]MDX5396087.1 hypothetical protein [Hymenobacteraceae bacterium]MDX5442474.1 hypothetical protein [Hymenobacteraceae bacterium]MDX5512152.1 hypothetical protein [Hymenobacteraceae bacterium]
MKKLLFIGAVLFVFGCESTTRETEVETEETEVNADESVEIGSGEEITPQLELEDTTGRLLKVEDTLSGSDL